MRDTKSEILDFWFVETKPAQWFQKNSDFDNEIRNRFERDYQFAGQGIYDGWQDDPKGVLALCIILDQFPRNMYRDSPQAFATDGKALDVAKKAVKKQFDHLLTVDEKAFLYLPFEHSETMEDQEKSVALFSALKADNPVYYDYAVRHYDVIKKFGRFPHRNAALGRLNTKLEDEYLAQPGSGF